MPILHITTHVADGQALLLSQFQNKPRIAGWLAAYVGEVQFLEDVLYDVLIKRLIDNAEGAQLDVIGKIVGEARGNHDDPTYRRFIYVRIKVNRSNGFPSDILQILALLDPTPRSFDEIAPANMLIQFTLPPVLDPVEIFDVLHDAKGGGVGLVLIVPTTTPDKQFLYCSVGDVSNPLNGYGDANVAADFGLLSTVVA